MKDKEKVFSTKFKLDSKMLALIYFCYQHKFPLCFMLSFYELYGDTSLFALKALSCNKRIKITDNNIIKILQESQKLYKQIITGVSTLLKIKELSSMEENKRKEEMPEKPHIDTSVFSEDFRNFVEGYLLKNIDDIYAPKVKLNFNTEDLYEELKP